jgi:hypothetical protein
MRLNSKNYFAFSFKQASNTFDFILSILLIFALLQHSIRP